MMRGIGERTGRALMEKQEFDVWALLHSLGGEKRVCPSDGKEYKKRGWFLRHMRTTGHWKGGQVRQERQERVEDDRDFLRRCTTGSGYTTPVVDLGLSAYAQSILRATVGSGEEKRDHE